MNARRLLAALMVGALGLTGCGIQPDSLPREVPDEEQALRIDTSSGSDASGVGRVYMIGPGTDGLLRSVQRDADTPEELIDTLFLGPNQDELEEQFSTAIPSTTRLLDSRPQGPFFYMDVSDDITELTGQALLQALAQIVYTASDFDGVEAVRITVNGEDIPWPRGQGGSSTGALTVYDYPDAVRTAQPDYPAVPSESPNDESSDE